MRVEQLETLVLQARVDERGNARGWSRERAALLVRLRTDDGLTGVGEAYGSGGTAMCAATAAIVERLLAPRVLGADPGRREALWWELYTASREHARNGLFMHALAAVDIALWDLEAQALGVPVHRLLGGAARRELYAYASGLMYRRDGDAAALAEEARAHADAGFRLVKLRAGRDGMRDDLARFATVRDAVGNGVGVAVDLNEAGTIEAARPLARELGALGCAWLEEPLAPEDRAGYAELRRDGHLPIAGGEAEHSAWGIAELVHGRCVDVLQPEPCGLGGLTELRRALAVASTGGVRVIPHGWGTSVALAVTVHVAASLPAPIAGAAGVHVEWDATANPLRDELGEGAPRLHHGTIAVGDDAGLGVRLDEAALERFAVARRTVRAEDRA